MKTYKLSEIAQIIKGTSPVAFLKPQLTPDYFPFFDIVAMKNAKSPRFLPPSFPKYIPKYTILISVEATVGEIYLTQEKSWFNNHIIAILANEEIILKKYLYYYFLTQQEKIKNLAKYFRCTIFASLPPKLFKNWLIPVPDLAT